MRSSKREDGISILEVVVACLILGMAIIPIYRSLTAQTSSEIETTKIAMAKDILKSLRQEILARPFDELSPHVKNGELEIQPYPLTLEKVLKVQKDFQNYGLKVFADFTDPAKQKVIQFKAEVTWKDNKQHEKKESLIFIQVSQK